MTERNKARRFLRLPEVIERVGLRHTQIYALQKAGKFPKSVRVGERAVAWVEEEIEAFQEERIAERDREAGDDAA